MWLQEGLTPIGRNWVSVDIEKGQEYTNKLKYKSEVKAITFLQKEWNKTISNKGKNKFRIKMAFPDEELKCRYVLFAFTWWYAYSKDSCFKIDE